MDVVSNRDACLDRAERNDIASKIDGLFGNGESSIRSAVMYRGARE